ncbi:MAG TPA: SPOR domain-containing protein [Steroidobacteraceae bacterium]|nr:SPOR domain-containing protein [Steroidobacteraceae bacterium]
MSTRALVTLFAVPLLCLAACSREKSDWRSAQAADSPESYEQFITEHPESTLVATARERLQQLAEEKDWRVAAGSDSLEAYQQFLAQYPAGKWAKEAQVRIENFSAGTAGSASGAAAAGESASPASPAGAGASLPDAPSAQTASGGYGVQLGAFSSAERANEEWKKLQADAAGLLDGLSPRVVVGETQGRTIYRLQAEVRDEVQARAVCGGLKVARKPCVPVLPHAGR